MAERVDDYLVQGMIDGSSHWERAGAAITKMAEAIGELAAAVVDEMWEYVTISRCDDRPNCRKRYLATVKVVNTGHHNPLVAEDAHA